MDMIVCFYSLNMLQINSLEYYYQKLFLVSIIFDTGYPHDGRADNTAYRHDRRADKRRYPHDREIDIQMLKVRNGYILN